jgi:hypothetical protein
VYINIESYIGYSSIKYAFKYIYKGPDYIIVALQVDPPPSTVLPRVDKIRDYVDA